MIKPSQIVEICQQAEEQASTPVLQSIVQVFSQGVICHGVTVKLYQNRLIFSMEGNKSTKNTNDSQCYVIRFTFGLCFELLYSGVDQKNRNIKQCYSIKLEKEQKYIEFRQPQDRTHFEQWRDLFRSKLNQRGFHQQFKPIKELGKGNFANVYQVQYYQNKKHYAVKAFNKKEAYLQEKGKQSLINEIEAMRAVNHPNLVKIFGVYQTKNSLYIVLELLAGGQLFDKINLTHKMKPCERREIMKSILMGAEALHQKGYMHRDLKPENILLKEKGSNECVIADFGLVEKVNSPQLIFARCGTPGYVAPEIASLKDSHTRYGSACDMFSIGVIFHILLVGKPPFQGSDCRQLLQQNKLCKFNFTSKRYQKLSWSQLDLLEKLLSKDPKQRITATQALQHNFFTQISSEKEENQYTIEPLKELSDNEKPKKQPKVKAKRSPLHNEYESVQSPLLMPKIMSRKNEGHAKEDSCLKFKMKQPIIPVREGSNSKSIDYINSPQMCARIPRPGESRFVVRLNHDSMKQNKGA